MKNSLRKIKYFVWKNGINSISSVSPTLATKIIHYKCTGEIPNLIQPKKFNDKLQWLKLYWNDPLVPICADKYGMYDYVTENSDPKILNNLLAVYNSTDEIKWEALPNKFALKCTHGCGYNIVTKNKSELDQLEVFQKLNEWMDEEFGKHNLEYHYDKIKPRIILEEYIENAQGLLPLDYKIYCFNGVAKLVLVCSEREEDLKLDFFDLNWNRLDIGHKKDESVKKIKKPVCFDEMVKHAEELAKPFPFVRVDFYDKDGVPILGELTFTPAANMASYYNTYGQEYLGSLLTLPSKKL